MDKEERKKMIIEIGKKMRNARKKANLTQQEVADRLGIERSVFARYETGMIEMPLGTFALYCAIVNISSDQILEGGNNDA